MPIGVHVLAIALCHLSCNLLEQIATAQTPASPTEEVHRMRSALNSSSSRVNAPLYPSNSKMPNAIGSLRDFGPSKRGARIMSVACDPYMTAQQEEKILTNLTTQDDANWSAFSLSRLRIELQKHFDVWIDRKQLEICGLDANIAMNADEAIAPAALGARIENVLRAIGEDLLTFNVRANRLEITSRDSADSRSIVRAYDVTPLVLRARSVKRVFDFDSLTQVVQVSIDPDSWIVAGGTNTIVNIITGETGTEPGLLVVPCSTPVHLHVQALLDRLNTISSRSGSFLPKPGRPPKKIFSQPIEPSLSAF